MIDSRCRLTQTFVVNNLYGIIVRGSLQWDLDVLIIASPGGLNRFFLCKWICLNTFMFNYFALMIRLLVQMIFTLKASYVLSRTDSLGLDLPGLLGFFDFEHGSAHYEP